MADITLTPQARAEAELTPSFTAMTATDNYYFDNKNEDVYMLLQNTGGAPVNVTIETPFVLGAKALADMVVSVPATTGLRVVTPRTAKYYNNGSGNVKVTASAACNIMLFK